MTSGSACKVPPARQTANIRKQKGTGGIKKLLSIFSTFCIIRITITACTHMQHRSSIIPSPMPMQLYISCSTIDIDLEMQSTKVPREPILITEN